jgi:hypothetical protein
MKLVKLLFVVVLLLVAVAFAFAQQGQLDPPGISQIVEGIMSAVGTWAAAWLANRIRTALGVSADVFLAVIVPLLGLGVSWLVHTLGQPGNSWLISFAMTLGSTWLDQLRVKLLERFA